MNYRAKSAIFLLLAVASLLISVGVSRSASYSSPFTNCFNDGDCENAGLDAFCRNRVCFSPGNQAPPICADRCDTMPYCPPGAATCGGHTVGVNGNTVHVTDCRGIGSGRRGGVISYCDQTGKVPTPTPPTPTPPTPTPVVPTPPPGTLADGRIIGTCKGWPNPHVEIQWSQNPPPGSQPKNSNSVKRAVGSNLAEWFFGGGAPGVYATRISGAVAVPWGVGGYPNPNYAVYDLRDDAVQAGSTYTYTAKYRPETSSTNAYAVTVNAANCGGSGPTPTPNVCPAGTEQTGTTNAIPPRPICTPIGIGDGRVTGFCTWSNGAPQVHVSWSQNPPPGQGAANSNTLQKGDCFPNDPGNYWCSLNNGAAYSFVDSTVVADTQYQYRVRYRTDLTSLNTYNIYTSGANCGIPPPSPAPLDVSPDYQTIPPNVTALFTATGGDGSYVWSVSEGALSGSGAGVGVVFVNNEVNPVMRTVTVSSGNQTATATIQVDGVETYEDDIDVTALGGRYVFVDGNAPITSSSYTTLTLAHGFTATATASVTMKLGNTLEAAQAVEAQPFQKTLPSWDLCEGSATCAQGLYTVYAIYLTPNEGVSTAVIDTIVYAVDDNAGNPTVVINDGTATTTVPLVTLALQSGFVGIPADEVSMQIANSEEGLQSAPAQFYSSALAGWNLFDGAGPECVNGPRTVFARFFAGGAYSTVAQDSIVLNAEWPCWGVQINNGDEATQANTVLLSLNPWFGVEGVQVYLSNTADFTVLATASYGDAVPWDLCAGLLTCEAGAHSVYVRYVDGTGAMNTWPAPQSPRYSDDIVLGATPTPTPTPLPAGVLIGDGAASVASRYVKLTFTSPFGIGSGVSMRPANENGLTPRDREIVRVLGGGIDSQPSATRQTISKPGTDTLRIVPSPTPLRDAPAGTVPNRTLQVDDVQADTLIPELDSGIVRKYVQQLSDWDVCTGAKECPYGTYKVFVQYYRTPAIGVIPGTFAALGDEVSGVYYDTVVFESPTPTPTPTVSLPPPISSVPPPAGTPPPDGGGGGGGVGAALEGTSNTIGLIALASSVAVVLSALVTLMPLLSGSVSGVFTFAWEWFMGVIGLLPKRKNVWGTVYDANTKRPIPFAKVQLLDRSKRVLETRIADKDGRYGFLTTPESLMAQNVQIQILPVANSYAFPSHTAPSVDTLIYNNLYFGDLITVSDKTLINYDVPMDPLRPSAAPLFLKSPSIALGASVAAVADAGFWLGVIMVPLNLILSPNPFTLGVFFLFFGTASLRIWGISEHPFGIINDSQTGRPMSFALITLNDLSGKRVAFTVTDEQGRYFLVVQKGTYELSAFTPATIQPGRQSKSTIEARHGWITREIKL